MIGQEHLPLAWSPRRIPGALSTAPSFGVRRLPHPAHELRGVRLDHAGHHARMHVLPVTLRRHEARLVQLLEVMRDRRLGHRELIADRLVGTLVAGRGDGPQDGEAARIGQRLRDALELTGRELTGLSGWHVHG